MTTQTMNSPTTPTASRYSIKVVNGARPANGAEGLVSVSAACRMIGVKQHGSAKKQMAKLGIPIVALGGARGGVYLVKVEHVMRAKAKREALANHEAKKSNVVELPPQHQQAQPQVDRVSELADQLVRLESKLDKLLAAWGVNAA